MLGDVLIISWHHKVLQETAIGYSDALYLLGIPHRLEYSVTRECDDASAFFKKMTRIYKEPVAVLNEKHKRQADSINARRSEASPLRLETWCGT